MFSRSDDDPFQGLRPSESKSDSEHLENPYDDDAFVERAPLRKKSSIAPVRKKGAALVQESSEAARRLIAKLS